MDGLAICIEIMDNYKNLKFYYFNVFLSKKYFKK